MDIKHIPASSMSAVKNGDRAGWLALFTDDVFVQDPVGPSAWDPEGKGMVGKDALASFYDGFAGYLQSFDYEVHHLATGNDEVAAFVTMHTTLKDGTKSSVKAINLYHCTQDGRIRSLRSFQNG